MEALVHIEVLLQSMDGNLVASKKHKKSELNRICERSKGIKKNRKHRKKEAVESEEYEELQDISTRSWSDDNAVYDPEELESLAGLDNVVNVPKNESDRLLHGAADMPYLGSCPNGSQEPTYCFCRALSYGDMVACDYRLCPYQWFHFGCVGLIAQPEGKWICQKCLTEPIQEETLEEELKSDKSNKRLRQRNRAEKATRVKGRRKVDRFRNITK